MRSDQSLALLVVCSVFTALAFVNYISTTSSASAALVRVAEATSTIEPTVTVEPTITVEPTVTPAPEVHKSKRTIFIEKWKPRINHYLKGSPLHGMGDHFAASAYDSGLDPRLSPAISCIESGKGRHCFRPHNAWGWYGHSFKSWEVAIDAHAHYLHRMYWGGHFSLRMAKRYCPRKGGRPWYNKVKREIAKI